MVAVMSVTGAGCLFTMEKLMSLSKNKCWRSLLWPVLAVLMSACTANGGSWSGAGSGADAEQADAAAAEPPWGVSFIPSPGIDAIMPVLARHRVIYIGETHSRYDHHLAQLRIIEALYRDNPDMAIALESFQQPFQPVLDDYIAGRIDENTMLRRSEYYQRWGFDYRLYRPILRFAREHKIPLIALNVSKELTARISKVGLAGLTPDERAQLPEQLDTSDEAYKQRLQTVFEEHQGKTGRAFERFYEVQLAWDEGMAAQAADYLRAHPKQRLVVLAGGGHLNAAAAIPARLERRLPVDGAVVVLGSPYQNPSDPLADYYLATRPQDLPRSGLLGVMLASDASTITITGFAHHSDARDKGLKKGDRIVAIDATDLRDYTDLKLLLMEKSPGDTVRVTVERGKQEAGQRREFSVVLK
jgi:uncharacterized iron-regulated protein